MRRATGKLLIGIVIVSLIAAVAGCGDETTTTTTSDTKARDSDRSKTSTVSATTGGASRTMEVRISDFKFLPADLTIPVGTTVKWTNEDSAPHTSTANDKAFDSGNLNQGDAFEFTFNEKGSFPYICTYHPFMVATITVE